MITLGLDPSLTGFGWALHNPYATGPARCPDRGRWKTSPKEEFVDRFSTLAERVYDLVYAVLPDRVGVESPSLGRVKSETMYALFTHTNIALKKAGMDVVFFAPDQIKVHPREIIDRPPKWKMMKGDMVEAAKFDTGGKGRWSGDTADAYWVAYASARFWMFHDGIICLDDLSKSERHQFLRTHTFKRGKKKGVTERKGLMYREGERFFLWSKGSSYGRI